MKKLIAARPIQYMGRTYERGETIPAHDGTMVAAWLNAGTAAWAMDDQGDAEILTAKKAGHAEHMAACVLRDLGVAIQDDNGNFVGPDTLEEQIRELAVGGQERPQEDGDGQDGRKHAETENGGQGGKDAAVERENAAGAPETLTGYLDPEQLAGMKKEALEKLAAQLNVDISKAKNNRERAALIRPPQLTARGAR